MSSGQTDAGIVQNPAALLVSALEFILPGAHSEGRKWLRELEERHADREARRIDAVSRLKGEAEKLERDLARSKSDLTGIARELESSKSQLASLRDEVRSNLAGFQDERREFRTHQETLSALQVELTETQFKLSAVRGDLKATKAERVALAEQIERNQLAFEAERKEHRADQEVRESLQDELTETQFKLSALQGELKAALSQQSALQHELQCDADKHQDMLDRYKTAENELVKSLELEVKRGDRLKTQVADLVREATESKVVTDQLTADIEKLEKVVEEGASKSIAYDDLEARHDKLAVELESALLMITKAEQSTSHWQSEVTKLTKQHLEEKRLSDEQRMKRTRESRQSECQIIELERALLKLLQVVSRKRKGEVAGTIFVASAKQGSFLVAKRFLAEIESQEVRDRLLIDIVTHCIQTRDFESGRAWVKEITDQKARESLVRLLL